ncbi:MAG: XdhC family protein [Porticoccaceae bacterium]|nr:XdhC family protein [Porticoccaceae bacterium]
MANNLKQLLDIWYPQRDTQLWVLATVYKTQGPSYRKSGAMMLFNDLGQQYGLLSGGCLEADIQRQAAKVMRSQQSLTVCYDGSDEDDISFQLGIGCGGTVYILLQPVQAAQNYLNLGEIRDHLANHGQGQYWQLVDENSGVQSHWHTSGYSDQPRLVQQDNQCWLVTNIKPQPHILVVGGGVDARPLVSMAKGLGWTVTLWDSRPANARREYFMTADTILDCPIEDMIDQPEFQQWDTAVVMCHNLQMDALAIKALQTSQVAYLALLGPLARQQQVLELAQLDATDLRIPIAGPAGLDLGAELPEGIALSILAECHGVLQHANGESLSGALTGFADNRRFL